MQQSKKAKNFLKVKSFSRKEVIEQIMHDGNSKVVAKSAVDNCEANWYEQARLAAKKYKEYITSIDFVYEMLIYDGFTEEEAKYGMANS